jgi:hypothetical protein
MKPKMEPKMDVNPANFGAPSRWTRGVMEHWANQPRLQLAITSTLIKWLTDSTWYLQVELSGASIAMSVLRLMKLGTEPSTTALTR